MCPPRTACPPPPIKPAGQNPAPKAPPQKTQEERIRDLEKRADIADRYHKALQSYLGALREVLLESAVDYHRVTLAEDYEQVLTRFLVGRTRARG